MEKLSYLCCCYLLFFLLLPGSDNKFYEMFAHCNNNLLCICHVLIFLGFLCFKLSHECYRVSVRWSFSHKSHSTVKLLFAGEIESRTFYVYFVLNVRRQDFILWSFSCMMMIFYYHTTQFVVCLFVGWCVVRFVLFKCRFIIAQIHTSLTHETITNFCGDF